MAEISKHHSSSYSCRNCQNPLAYGEDLLSTAFLVKTGPAKTGPGYLFLHVMNVELGPEEDRQLLSGKFSIAEIYCSKCGEILGWKYVEAYEVMQRYKEGKFILEKLKMIEEN